MCGDYNTDLLKYECHQISTGFSNQVFSYGFYPFIMSPTPVTGTTSTLIDNINTIEIGLHMENDIMINDVSDQLTIFSLLKYKNVKRKSAMSSYKFVHQTRHTNINNFTDKLNWEKGNWNDVYIKDDVNLAFKCLHKQIC